MRLRVSLSLVAVLSLMNVAAKADTFTDGFVGYSSTSIYSATTVGNFTTGLDGHGVQTNVDYLTNPGDYGILCGTFTACIDLGGSAGVPSDPQGILVSNTLFAPGVYTLSYEIGNPGRGLGDTTTVVTFGGYINTITLDYCDDPVIVTTTVDLTTASTLTFTDGTPGNQGDILDYATVTSVTPEPSSLVLLGSGLLTGAGALLRRRKK